MSGVRRAVLLLIAGLAACAYQERFLPAERPVERALVFTEVDRRGDERMTSAPADDPRRATRVPQPATLDVDSTLRIEVRKDQLLDRAPALGSRIDEGKELRQKLEGTLEQIQRAQAAEQSALKAFAEVERQRSPDQARGALERFVAARREFGRSEEELTTGLIALWRGTPHENAIEDAAGAADPWAGMRSFVEARIAELDRGNAALEAALDERRYSLRLSASLESSGGERTYLHLEGYDTLPEGRLQPFDRSGLVLSAEDSASLRERWSQTVDIANALDAVNRGEASLRETLKTVLPVLAPELRAAVEELAAATQDMDAFRRDLATLRAGLPRLAEAVAAALEEAMRDTMKQAGTDLLGLLGLDDLIARSRALVQRARAMRPEDAISLVAEAASIVDRFKSELRAVVRRGVPDEATLEAWLVTLAGTAEEAARSAVRAEIARDEWKELREAAGRVLPAFRAIGRVAGALAVLPRGGKEAADPIHPPKTLTVPFDEIRDTFLDLTLTPRRRDDRLVVRGSLLQDDRVIGETAAAFALDVYGWHATLSPAVVLVRPDSLGGADPSWGFAPSLSWMHSYRPRPDEGGVFAGIMRGLEPAGGIHAVFLNFDPDKEVEIGMGATFSLWGNRLQAGVGYNLMNEDGVGDVYYFVGSDLIALLQDIGVAGK